MKTGREILDVSFFTGSPVSCARGLIGCEFFCGSCSGVIVETEAYAEHGDEACHTAFRPSARRFVEEHAAGTAYVYLNYGVHWLFNVLVKGDSGGGFVLLRALEPRSGLGLMRKRRKKSEVRDLCSGPGKLTEAFGIDGAIHGEGFLGRSRMGIYRGGSDGTVLSGPRIGISKETGRLWRFGLKHSSCLSALF